MHIFRRISQYFIYELVNPLIVYEMIIIKYKDVSLLDLIQFIQQGVSNYPPPQAAYLPVIKLPFSPVLVVIFFR